MLNKLNRTASVVTQENKSEFFIVPAGCVLYCLEITGARVRNNYQPIMCLDLALDFSYLS